MVKKRGRITPNCGKCKKKMDRVGWLCYKCLMRGRYKSSIKQSHTYSKIDRELGLLKPEIKKQLHDELLKEIIEEEKL